MRDDAGRWLRRTLPACLMGGTSALLLASGALADSAHLSLDPDRGPPGTTVAAHGTGFCASCGPVEIDFGARAARRGIVVGSDGSFQTTLQVPGGVQAGTGAVNAYQQGGLVTQTAFTVTPSAAAPNATAPPQASAPPGGQSPGAGSAPTPGTPAANGAGPSATPSGAPTSLGAGGRSSGPPAAVMALSAIAGVVVLAAAAALLYRRRPAKSP